MPREEVSLPIGTWIEFQLFDKYAWFRGIICSAEEYGMWYDVAMEDSIDLRPNNTDPKHKVYRSVWHERIRRRFM